MYTWPNGVCSQVIRQCSFYILDRDHLTTGMSGDHSKGFVSTEHEIVSKTPKVFQYDEHKFLEFNHFSSRIHPVLFNPSNIYAAKASRFHSIPFPHFPSRWQYFCVAFSYCTSSSSLSASTRTKNNDLEICTRCPSTRLYLYIYIFIYWIEWICNPMPIFSIPYPRASGFGYFEYTSAIRPVSPILRLCTFVFTNVFSITTQESCLTAWLSLTFVGDQRWDTFRRQTFAWLNPLPVLILSKYMQNKRCKGKSTMFYGW